MPLSRSPSTESPVRSRVLPTENEASGSVAAAIASARRLRSPGKKASRGGGAPSITTCMALKAV